MLDQFISKVQSKLMKLELSELHELQQSATDEAVKVALKLSMQPLPAMPQYEVSKKAESLADFIDDILEKVPNQADAYGSKAAEEEWYSEEKSNIPDAEATATCMAWKEKYNVVVGVSWGTLPSEIQEKWIVYSCDYHLLDEAEEEGHEIDDPATQKELEEEEEVV